MRKIKVFCFLLITIFFLYSKVYSQEIEFSLHTIVSGEFTADGATSVYAVDVDGDGDMDLLSASGLDDKIAWYENDGDENLINLQGTDESRDLLGYNIYLDSIFIGFYPEFYIQVLFYLFVPGQTYIIGIEPVYTNGTVPIIEFIYIYNPDLNSVQDFSVTNSGYVSWDPPVTSDNSRELLGYNVYLGVDFVSFTTDLFYQYDENSLIPEQTYVSGVTAVYDEGESSTEFAFFNYSLNNPIIIVDPEEIYVTLDPDESIDVDLTVSNPGTDVLFFNIEVLDAPWILINPNVYYSLEAGEFIVVSIPISAVGLEDITMTAELIFENNAGQDVIVPVTMVVTGNLQFNPPENVQVDEYTGLVTWDPPGGTIYGDDFESYTVGEYLAVQSDDWTTWSNNPGSAEDAFISDDYALSGTNSVKVDGTTDLVLIMDNYTEGCYSMDLNMYIPNGYCGYYNLQKTNIPGTEWGFQIMFAVDGIALINGGAAAACVFPFDFDTWMNFEVMVDLDSDLCEFYYDGTLMHSYQWTLGTFGTPGLLQLGGVNMYAWAAAGNNPLYYFDDVTFKHVNAEQSDELIGYNVYLDGLLLDDTTALEYQLTDLVYYQDYVAGVSAVYDDPGESEIIEVNFIYLPGWIPPPLILVAELVNYNDVHLEWIQPSTGGVLAHHSGYDNNGIGAGLTEWYCAARFDVADLSEYYDLDLTSVNVHIRTADFSYMALKIWEGGSFGDPGTEIYSTDITDSVLIEEWTEHTLTSPIPLVDGNEYWIGYEIHATGDHPSSVDAGPAVPEKGDWIYMYLLGWQEIRVAFALDYNWCIEGVVDGINNTLCTNPTEKKRVDTKIKTHLLKNMVSNGTPEVVTSHPRIKRNKNNRESRILLGYKVYRDNVVIAEIEDPNTLTYDDLALDGGTFEYWVTAIYDTGESEPTNIEEITVILYPPINLTATIQGNYVFITWGLPGPLLGRNFDFFNIYYNSVYISSTTYTSISIPLPSSTFEFGVTAVYDGGWESPGTSIIIYGSGVNDTPFPVVTELIGNYPNPFNPETTIEYALNEPGNICLEVYNIRGQKVRTLVSEFKEIGYHSVIWDGNDSNGNQIGSGIYFYQLKADDFQKVRKMILIK